MKLNYNTTTAKLYRWFWNTNEMPKSICPYFWKLLLMWIFIIPQTVLSIPLFIKRIFDRQTFSKLFYDFGNKFFARTAFSIVIFFFSLVSISVLYCIVYALLSLFMNFEDKSFIILGFAFLSIIIVAIITGLFLRYYDKRSINRNNKPRKNNIIREFIKSKYNKYCTKLEWEKYE